ncbi:hypothetical protein HPP92_018685 [Vanilla planifolia]|uniref:Uncharacterized protein n=1 Tax=Vanilla planifolia TaxID=51239 RepID=A0A835Q663_VANPL|nr:hypothetical protein HPP92_018685 [Vanilla planifolia]
MMHGRLISLSTPVVSCPPRCSLDYFRGHIYYFILREQVQEIVRILGRMIIPIENFSGRGRIYGYEMCWISVRSYVGKRLGVRSSEADSCVVSWWRQSLRRGF